jgi:hypothetical protein
MSRLRTPARYQYRQHLRAQTEANPVPVTNEVPSQGPEMESARPPVILAEFERRSLLLPRFACRGSDDRPQPTTTLLDVSTLARDWMVGLEEVARVVTLFNRSEAIDRLRRERLGHLEVLLRKVEVATGVIGLERSFEGC